MGQLGGWASARNLASIWSRFSVQQPNRPIAQRLRVSARSVDPRAVFFNSMNAPLGRAGNDAVCSCCSRALIQQAELIRAACAYLDLASSASQRYLVGGPIPSPFTRPRTREPSVTDRKFAL